MHQGGILALTLALLTGCGTANLPENLAADQTTAPLAVLEGEELSPDGKQYCQRYPGTGKDPGSGPRNRGSNVGGPGMGYSVRSMVPGQSLPGSGIRCLYLASSTYHRD